MEIESTQMSVNTLMRYVIKAKEKVKRHMKKLMEQIVKFGIVGAIATVVDMGVLILLKELFGINPNIAAAISFTISVVFNYICSMKFVFERRDDMSRQKEFIIFLVLSIIGLVINEAIMIGLDGRLEFLKSWVLIYRWEYMLRKVVATLVVLIWNFVSRKLLLEKK